MNPPQAAAVGRESEPAELPRRPFLFVNPSSGGGRATRAGLVDRARARGIRVVVLTPHQDLAALVREAVASGADALAVAGGDGSLGPVAAIAAADGLPFACVPAGTKNHFALDLGIDRHDLLGALDALTDGIERRIDVGEVNGRTFLNNVSLGIYADAVRRPAYRDAKVRTLLETAEEVLGPSAALPDLHLVDDLGREHTHPAVLIVSNNPYELDRPVAAAASDARQRTARGGRPRRAAPRPSSAGAGVDHPASRGRRLRPGARGDRRRGGRSDPAAGVRDPARSAPREDLLASSGCLARRTSLASASRGAPRRPSGLMRFQQET